MPASSLSQLADYRGPSLAERLRPLRSPWRSFRRRLLRRPGSTLAMVGAAAAMGAIITNALALQTERHPSPMFTALTDPRAETQGPVQPAAPAQPPRAQAERRAEAAPAAREPKTARPPREEQRAAAPASGRDQLNALLADTTATTATTPPAAPPAEADRARIVAIQKALIKAGYGPLKADGAFGAGSRAALEKFEVDRKLPVRGEPQGRSIRELARVSGLAID